MRSSRLSKRAKAQRNNAIKHSKETTKVKTQKEKKEVRWGVTFVNIPGALLP